MSRYTKVYSRIWRDSRVKSLSSEDRELYLYLRTSPHLNMVGFYYLPIVYAADDLQRPLERVSEGFRNLSKTGLIRYDEANSVVLVVDYLRDNPLENPNQAKGACSILGELPKTPLFLDFLECVRRYAEPFINGFETLCQQYAKPDTDTDTDTDPEKVQIIVPPDGGTDDPPPEPKRHKFTEEHMGLAVMLRDLILENKPDAKVPATLDGWANTARLMVEVDKRAPARIIEVIEWCQKNEFWRSNILSMGKLREQFDQLELQMQRGGNRRSGQRGGAGRKPPTGGKYDDLVIHDPDPPLP